MSVKKKSRVTPGHNPRKPENRNATKQNSSRRSSIPPGEGQPGSSRHSRPADREDLWVREDLWIAEKTSLSRQQDVVAWTPHTVTPSDARLLELADIALGLRKPEPFRRRKSAFFARNR